jgi:putative ATPase
MTQTSVSCPICLRNVPEAGINAHLDAGCVEAAAPVKVPTPNSKPTSTIGSSEKRQSTTANALGASRRRKQPLAELCRPKTLDDVYGLATTERQMLVSLLDQNRLPSLILWGPPGSGI